jgi:hypothetical protein
VHLTAQFPEPLYPYVLHAAGGAGIKLVYPDAGDAPEKTEQLALLHGRGIPTGARGAHMVLLLAAREPMQDSSILARQANSLFRDLREAFRQEMAGRRADGDGGESELRRAVDQWRSRHPEWVVIIPRGFIVGQTAGATRRDPDRRSRLPRAGGTRQN